MKTQIRFTKTQLPLTITGGFNMNRFTHPLTRAFKILSVFILLTISFVHAQFVNMSGHIIAGEMNGIVAPLPGAHVNIQGTDAQAVSDSTGFYELSFLWNWNGPVTAECHAEGFGSQSETFFPNSDTVELDFLLNPLPDEDITHLQGHILQIECGDCPIPGAQITAFNINSPSDETYTTHSAENGHYLLPLPLVPEYGFTWNITVQHPGFQAQSLQLEIGPAGMIHDFILAPAAPDPTIGVYGHVFAPSPNGMAIPVPGALISVYSADSSDVSYTTESNTDGYYELHFGPGNYTLTCTRDGFIPYETSFWVGDVPVHLVIVLQHQFMEDHLVFSGTVNGAVGGMLPAYEPLHGAHVEVFYSDDSSDTSVETTTNAEGHFSFFVDENLQGFPLFQEALVRVSAEGFAMQGIWLNFNDWPVFHQFFLELIPTDDVFLSGYVMNAGDEDPSLTTPIAGAHVQIFGGFSGGLLAETLTEDDGYYQFGDVVYAAYMIRISAEGYLYQEHPLPGYNGQYPMELDFILTPGEDPLPYIAGHVYSADSLGTNLIIPGAFLHLNGFDNTVIEETHSNQNGYYQFMSNGLTIDVSAFGYISQTVDVPQVDCSPGNHRCWPVDLDIYLQPDDVPPGTGIVFGVVTAQLSPMGPQFPVAGAQIIATSLWGNDLYESTETNDLGEYSLELPANNVPWIVTCSTEYGTQTHQVVVPPNGLIPLNFHFNAWQEPQIPAPYNLTATPGTDENGNLVVFLNWQYPPAPDPTIFTQFFVYLVQPDNNEWILVGTTPETGFVFVLNNMPDHPLCFAVNAASVGMVSEFSNTACAHFNEAECFDLSGIDFGPCDMVLGAGLYGDQCAWISGCNTESGGVDYSMYFFDTMVGCMDSCLSPPETGVVYGWVTVQFSPEGPTIPISGAEVTAGFPNDIDGLATAITNEEGYYEMVLPAHNWGYIISCTTEFGTLHHTISLLPGAEVNVNFHWDTWQEPTVPAPFDLTATYNPDIPSWGGIFLQWQYPPLPNPDALPEFHVYGNFVDPNGGWTEIGSTENMMFIYHLTGLWNPQEVCFAVTAMVNGVESELSNIACSQTTPTECFDLSGIDFGDCEMVLGIGWNGEECVIISGCSTQVDGIDYAPYFFSNFMECHAACENAPPWGTAILTGTVYYLFGDVFDLISGAQIVATGSSGIIYETLSNNIGTYELQMIAGTYTVTCTLPDSGESHSESITITDGDIMVLDFWFGESYQYVLFGMVYSESLNGEVQPLDGAHIIVHFSGTVYDGYSNEGAYWITLPPIPGEYLVSVDAEGYIGSEEWVNVSGLTELNFFLQPLDSGLFVVNLNLGSATAMPGDTVSIPIVVGSELPVGGVQFTVTDIPDEVTAISYLSHFECFTASFNEVAGSVITIFFSPDGCVLDPDDHDIATLIYVISAAAPAGDIIELTPVDVVIANPNGEAMEVIAQGGSITLGSVGDVNIDSEVNVLDIVQLVNFILQVSEPGEYEFFAGDINGDNVLNVLDVVQLVNLIMGENRRSPGDRSSSVTIQSGNGILSIQGSGIAGFQLETQSTIHLNGWDLPEGWIISTFDDRLVAYTMKEPINGISELYYSGELIINEVLFSDMSGQAFPVNQGMLPQQIQLYPIYPNPFNPVTHIGFEIPTSGDVTVTIYDITGRRIAGLVDGYLAAGFHRVEFNGEGQASGTFIVTLKSDGQVQSRKILLLK